MYLASNNHVREDSIFSLKVKSAIAKCDGSLVPALTDFEQRHAAATEGGAEGLSYKEFLEFLRAHGVSGLSEFETNYLCNSFDDGLPPKKNEFISAATFTRHLTGLNYRRMKAVLQAWQNVLEVTGATTGTVPAAALISTYKAAQPEDGTAPITSYAGGSQRAAQLQNTFSASAAAGDGLLQSERVRGPALFAQSRARQTSGDGDEEAPVSKVEFVAFYASVSPESLSDEAFEVMVLKEWAADRPSKPKLQTTVREWGENGDPLAINETHYVHDALKMELGISSQSYNYTHMLREQPYVEPLPPLDREDLMESMAQRMYKPYDAQARTFADPLATRRRQLM